MGYSNLLRAGDAVTLPLYFPSQLVRLYYFDYYSVWQPFMQLGRPPPIGVQGAVRSIPSDVPLVIWHMGESFLEILFMIWYIFGIYLRIVHSLILYEPQLSLFYILSATIFNANSY